MAPRIAEKKDGNTCTQVHKTGTSRLYGMAGEFLRTRLRIYIQLGGVK